MIRPDFNLSEWSRLEVGYLILAPERFDSPNLYYHHKSIQITSHRPNSTPSMARCLLKHSPNARNHFSQWALKGENCPKIVCVRSEPLLAEALPQMSRWCRARFLRFNIYFKRCAKFRRFKNVGSGSVAPKQVRWLIYIYSIITTAFLEGVIWQISVSAPSAR